VFRDLLLSALAIAVISQAAAVVPSQQPAGNVAAVNVPAPVPSDPATVIFANDVGLMLHAVKPGSVADYENAIVALQEVLSKAEDPETRQVASGWRVYKASEQDAKPTPLYIHVLLPAVAGVDYRPSLWLDKLLAGAPPDLLAKYRDAFAAPPTRIGLVEFAQMSVAPVAKPTNASPQNATPPKPPSNASPSNATPPKPPGGLR
jgi:hypothetical protein